jgi:predicted nucleic acid-binding protein
MASAGRPFILDTNCFIDASLTTTGADAFAEFCTWAAPRLYLSTVVAAELRAGAAGVSARRKLERLVLAPYVRRGRLVNPSPAAWAALGTTLATLVEHEGLVLRDVRRSFVFDILVARSCREVGGILVSRNTDDLSRIASVFAFDFVAPYPPRSRPTTRVS